MIITGIRFTCCQSLSYFPYRMKIVTTARRSGIPAPIIYAELGEVPWVGFWWSQVLRFMQTLAKLDAGSLHARILLDNIHDAQANPVCGNWAAGVQKQYSSLGMPSPFAGQGLGAVDAPVFRKKFADDYKKVWADLHVSPRTAPSARAKYCTYLRWFSRPGQMPAEPYFDLPISFRKLKMVVQFRLGSHNLPIEQGRMARPAVPRHLRRCTLCSHHAPGDERHYMLECPHFDLIRAQYSSLLQDAHDSMRDLMWHRDQKGLADFVCAILNEAF